MNDDVNQDDVNPVIETDRSAVKVSMIKKNNEIIYQNRGMIENEPDENLKSTLYQKFAKIKKLRGGNDYQQKS
jgi:hypothetical protein